MGNWLEYLAEKGEILETNGVADVVVGYANNRAEAETFAEEAGMRISIPPYAF